MKYEMLCGVNSITEALKAKKRSFSGIYISKDRNLTRLNDILKLAQTVETKIDYVSAEYLDQLSNGTKHQGVVAKVSAFPVKRAEDEIKSWDNLSLYENDNKKKLIVVIENIEDPHNLGAIIRTSVCAGVDHIVIPKDRSVQPTPAVSRVSAGAMEYADIHVVTNTASYLKSLKKKRVWILGLEADGETELFNADFTDNIAIVIGGEHKGIRSLVKKECDFLLSLPLTKGVTSLNASVACGIALYEAVRQRLSLKILN